MLPYTIVQSYVKAGCGELNVKKTFTFGNDKARGILGSDVHTWRKFASLEELSRRVTTAHI